MAGPIAAGQPPAELLRVAVLVLIAEDRGHGYELNERLVELGLPEFNKTRLYRLLRSLETEGVITSQWEPAERGPARRVYAITERAMDELCDTVEVLTAQRQVIAALVRRMRTVCETGGPHTSLTVDKA